MLEEITFIWRLTEWSVFGGSVPEPLVPASLSFPSTY